jgi:RNA polymerase sigma-70 factor (ECF subfamily)
MAEKMLFLGETDRKLIEVLATRAVGTVPMLRRPSTMGRTNSPAPYSHNTARHPRSALGYVPMSGKQPSDLGLERFRDYLCLLARAHLHPRHHRRFDPSDVAQQTLLEAYQKREQFRGTSDAETAGWLRQILVHNIADAVRAMAAAKRDTAREQPLEGTNAGSSSDAVEGLIADQTPADAQLARIDDMLALAGGLAQLPERQREAVVLHHLQGWTLAQLAAQLACTEGAAAALLHRGLKQLRAQLKTGD